MAQLLCEKLEIQSNEFKQRFFSTPSSQSACQWRQVSSSRMLDGFPVGVAFLDENLAIGKKLGRQKMRRTVAPRTCKKDSCMRLRGLKQTAGMRSLQQINHQTKESR